MSADGHDSMPQLQEASLVGEVLDGRYRIIKKLGEGGMGEVYAAEHIHIEKRFAIKLLRPEILGNPEAVTRFRQEARSSSSIGHRNIIAVEDFGTLPDGRIYMCMELLAGAALNDLITTPQPIDRLLNIMIQTGHGLAAAHAKGIVHRDMKPENIYVTINAQNEDIPKLLDFGIAKVAGNDGQNNLTRTGTIFGTPFYMAPEQALGNPVDARTDIYAVGVIMYEIFAGSLPFQGESFMGILTQHITTEPEPVASRAAKAGRQLPNGLADIITRCMQKNPAQRFSSMDELVNELIQIYRGIAGAGMSTYMQAFPVPVTSARMAVPTPGGMTASPGVHPTVGVGGPPMQTPYGMPQVGSGPSPAVAHSGPNYTPVPSTGLYDPNATVVPVKKKSKTGLIIAIIAVLAAGGGVAAFVLVSQGGGSGSGSGSGSVGSNDVGSGSGSDVGSSGSNLVAGSNGSATKQNGSDGSNTVGSGSDTLEPPSIDAGVVVAEIDAGATEQPIDAGVTAIATIKVKIYIKNRVPFDVLENGTKLFEGPDSLEITPGAPRTVVLHANGLKDKTLVIDGKEKKIDVRLERLTVLPPPCTATSCPAGQSCKDGKCKTTVVIPPRLDCSSAIKDPKSKQCVAQYCAGHKDNPICDAE